MEACHLFIDGTALLMSSRQIHGGHEELVDDLPAGEHKCFLQDLNIITARRV
jgi:hypothetical protein